MMEQAKWPNVALVVGAGGGMRHEIGRKWCSAKPEAAGAGEQPPAPMDVCETPVGTKRHDSCGFSSAGNLRG